MVLTGYFVLSPVIGLVCHRRFRIWRVKTRLGLRTSANLTPASRRQNHTTSPSAAPLSAKGFDGLSAVRLRAIRSLTGLIDPPCHPLASPDAAASTASRPASVTIASRPSVGRDGEIMELIWVRPEAKFFCKQDWTAQISLIPHVNFVFSRGSDS